MLFEIPTVLVVGAGGSVDFGFPMGRALALDISKKIDHHNDYVFPGLINHPNELIPLEINYSDLKDFGERLFESNSKSVDLFLETNPRLLRYGKYMIATCLWPLESKLTIRKKRIEGETWYEFLLNKLGNTEKEIFSANLSIVTFNYDRSLEYFLYSSWTNRFNDAETAKELLNSINLVHVYGSFGPLPHEPRSNSVPYGIDDLRGNTDQRKEILKSVMSNLTVIHESDESSETIRMARDWISDAHKLAFIGFGYHPLNIERLFKDNDLQRRSNNVFGTFYEMGDFDVSEARTYLSKYDVKFVPENTEWDALEFLHNSRFLSK